MTNNTAYRAKLVREYQEQVWCEGSDAVFRFDNQRIDMCMKSGRIDPKKRAEWNAGRIPWDRATLTLTWRHHRVGPDADNALASCKPLIDVLKATGPRPLGIFVDDSPDCLEIMPMRVEKVASKSGEGIVIEIERIEAWHGKAGE
jgi:hypothetical protein